MMAHTISIVHGACDVLSYLEMCQEEGLNLQQGMNFRIRGGSTVILMSVRAGAPYSDEVQETAGARSDNRKAAIPEESRTVYTSEEHFSIRADDEGVELESVPPGTKFVIEHRTKDGTQTRIRLERE